MEKPLYFAYGSNINLDQIRIFTIRNRISGLTERHRSGMLAAPASVITP